MCVGVSWLPLSASLHSSKCPILIAMFPCSFFSVCADTLFLWLYEFHRDATRHNLRFMFFIIISFVNFCIAHSLSLSRPLCVALLASSSSFISISRTYLFISLIYITWMRTRRARTPFIWSIQLVYMYELCYFLATCYKLERYSTWFHVLIALLLCFFCFAFLRLSLSRIFCFFALQYIFLKSFDDKIKFSK